MNLLGDDLPGDPGFLGLLEPSVELSATCAMAAEGEEVPKPLREIVGSAVSYVPLLEALALSVAVPGLIVFVASSKPSSWALTVAAQPEFRSPEMMEIPPREKLAEANVVRTTTQDQQNQSVNYPSPEVLPILTNASRLPLPPATPRAPEPIEGLRPCPPPVVALNDGPSVTTPCDLPSEGENGAR